MVGLNDHYVGCWLEEKLLAKFENILRDKSMTKSEALRQMIREFIETNGGE